MEKYTIDEEFLGRWVDNRLTSDELAFFKNSPDYELYKKINQTADNFKPLSFNVDQSFDKLMRQIQEVKNEPKVISLFDKTKYIIGAVAASVVLLIGFFVINFNKDINVKTGIAEKIDIELPDGSIVQLNSNSKLSYNKKRFLKNRNLQLNGEAYFKVAKGSKFTVQTSAGNVSVLGTQFNVMNRENIFETICYEGKVRVEAKGGQRILNPNQGVRFYNNTLKDLKVKEQAPGWISNISYFDAVPLSLVILELKNQYKVTIQAREIDQNQIVTTYFVHDNLKEALQTVFTPLKINYTFAGKSKIVLKD